MNESKISLFNGWLMNESIHKNKYILGVILIGLLILSLIFMSNAYAGVSSPVTGFGEKVATVKFTAYGTWTHVSVPGGCG